MVQFRDAADKSRYERVVRGTDLRAILAHCTSAIVDATPIPDPDELSNQICRALIVAQASLISYLAMPDDIAPASNYTLCHEIGAFSMLANDWRAWLKCRDIDALVCIQDELTRLYHSTHDPENSKSFEIAKSAVCAELATRGG